MPNVNLLRAFAAAGLAVAVLCGEARADPAMWRVTGAKGAAILFGSIHLLPAKLEWRDEALSNALTNATELWFEIPLGDEADARAARLLQAKGRLPRGDTLSAHLSPDLLRRLDIDAAALGLDPSALETMRCWLADATLSIAADMKSGADTSGGVERRIDGWTPLSAKRRALETAADQVGVLADGATDEQIAMLSVTLDEIEAPDRYPVLVTAWLAGDLADPSNREALDPLAAASPRAYRALITDRNRRWAQEIEHRLKRGGRIVVVVGIGHLIGPESVPALLKAAGLTVSGP